MTAQYRNVYLGLRCDKCGAQREATPEADLASLDHRRIDAELAEAEGWAAFVSRSRQLRHYCPNCAPDRPRGDRSPRRTMRLAWGHRDGWADS